MKFFMEKNKDAGHRVTINIPKTTVNETVLKKLIKISQTKNINGFRKGKIPIKVVQEKYGNSVYYDVFNELMQKFFHEFICTQKIKIIGTPKYYIHEKEDNKKKYFIYSVVYELYPNFQIKDLQNIEVIQIITKITDNDIKKNIDRYKNSVQHWNTVNKAIKNNDRVTINYSIYEKNKKIEKFDAENVRFIVSENTLLPQLKNKIINHLVNDIIFFKIKFYQLHPEKELQNKEITFKIKITKIEKKEEKNEEDTAIENKQEKLNKSYYQNIKNNLIKKTETLTQKYLQDQITHKLIKNNPILIPPILFQEEIQVLYNKNIQQYYEYKHNILEKKYHDNLESKIKKRLHIQIIIEKIISDNKLLIDEETIQELIKKISLNYKKPLEIINLYNKNKNLKRAIKNMALEMKVMHFLTHNIKVKKQHWTFDQIINHKWKNYKELLI